MQKLFIPSLLALSLFSVASTGVSRAADASFTVSTSTTKTQSLGSGQTGTITSSGSITDANDEVVITVDNKSAGTSLITISNAGTINNTYSTDEDQSSRDIRITAANTHLEIDNASTGIIETSNADVIQEGKNIVDTVFTLNNRGLINSKNTNSNASADFGKGQQGIDFGNETSGSFLVNNYAGATIEAFDSDAIQSGANATINNDGTISSTEPSGDLQGNDGIDAQTNSNITITNGAAISGDTASSALISGARHGITGGNISGTGAYSMSITNNANATIQGNDGSGVNIDGINGNELVIVTNHGTITGNGVSGDGDGVDVDGLVHLDNFGTIKSLGANNDTSEGVTVGGGTIKNEVGALIEGDGGSSGVGITLAGVDKDSNDNPIPPQGIYATSSVDNFGTIKGQTGAGIQATSTLDTFGITITNEVGGTIEGGGTGAAIQLDAPTGTVVNKIINSGTITADSSGKAIDLGGTNNEVDIVGGSATVNGSISGGGASSAAKFVVDATAGGTVANGKFSYSNTISNFATTEVKTGTFTLNGTISGGTTTIDSGATLAGNAHVGALVIAAGSTLSPGNSPGKITATSAVLNPTGNFLLQVDTDGSTGVAGTNWDQLAVSGTVDGSALGTGANQQLVFNLQSLQANDTTGALASWNPNANHVWHDVITSAGFTTALTSQDFSVNSSGFVNSLNGSFSMQVDGNSLDLVYTVAPEPGTWAMMIGGLGLLVGITRWRKLSI